MGIWRWQEKAKKNRKRDAARKKKLGALGNLVSLKDALPAVEKKHVEECKKTEKPRVSKPLKIQAMEMKEDINVFREVMSNSFFKADPFYTMYENVRLRLAQK
ncbi:hypothetical protein NPIL_157641 [Nephila pilipes]|uniref:Uncharacterized protein n=1 Tax=Nephila pilipes TaxID=299642 RepID=A0A8X6NP73_NEPPI|nr:hypothetical protein NPIL_157641 [Nephila pilipes]